MKRKCKNVDITNIKFIENAIQDCLNHKTHKKLLKRGYYDLFDMYGDDHGIALQLQKEIKERCLELPPVRYVDIVDSSNGKQRTLTVEHIKQQFYDYIAFHGLAELYSRFGYYQINIREHGSPIMACRYVQSWMNDKDVKYVVQMDIKKCYPSITHENMMGWLRKHVKNDDLLWLIEQLLSTCDIGLPIGSRLSINLCALYLSDIYHHIESHYYTFRKGKKRRIFKHVLFYLDDVFLFGSNARQMRKATNDLIQVYARYGLTIKSDWKLICLKYNRKHTHIDVLGYKVYHNRVTMRHRDYIKTRRAIRKCKQHPKSLRFAQGLVSLYGLFVKHTTSEKFKLKYNAKKYFKQAKEMISKYGKSLVYETPRTCNC